MEATEDRLVRHRLWALFDRIAVSILLGLVTNVVIMCPPQHGKSQYWSKYFPAWYLRHKPDSRIILGSYAAGYAAGWGRETRDVVMRNGGLIGQEVRDDVSGASEWKLSGHEGGMITSGYEGGISGRPAELAIVDDPIKDAAVAVSKTEKDKIWLWWQEELSSRLQRRGVRVLLMTRRAVDDPIGRVLKLNEAGKEKWTVIKLPAIAEEDEYWPELKWQRKTGEALCPELHPIEELRQTESAVNPNTWAGLYQQRPYPRGGGDLKSEWFKIVRGDPAFATRVRAWDLAYSESPTAKRTAGVLMTKRREGESNKYHIADVNFGRWGPGIRNEKIKQQAQIDGRGVPIVLEEEGGSGGPAQVDELVRLLDGWAVIRSRAAKGGSKELRAMAMGGQAQVGNVTLREAPSWNAEFAAEVDSFPGGPTIDMVDAAAHAYNYLAGEEIARIPAGAQVILPGMPRPFSSGPRRFGV
jgi:predicted phage terminase large subunit-like protein